MNSNQVIRVEAVAATFNIYTDHEKAHLLSVTRIEQPVALDSDGKAIPGGLYDESMGPLDHSGVCHTCHLKYAACSGHPGHIELYFPVYYPVLFSSMFQLLKSKCFYCHKLRMSLDRVRVFLVKLKLLEMGDVEGANTLDDSLQPSQDLFDEEGVGKGRNSSSSSVDAEPMLRTAEHKYRQYRRNATPAQRAASQDSFITDRQNQVIDAFQRACVLVKGCENCNALTAPLRQDQSIKVFQKPMPKRQRKFAESKLRQKSAMESLSLFGLKPYSEEFTEMLMVGAAVTEAVTETTNEAVDDSSDEGESSLEEDGSSDGQSQHSFSESDHYLMPIEVEAQLRLLWMHHQEMLDFIWLRATGLHRGSSGSGDTKRGSSSSEGSGDGWRMFFTRVVLVPPSRFRPPGKVGDMIAEHPQNTHLKKVLVADAAIRAIYSPDTQQQDPTADQPHPQQAPDSSASASAPIDLSKVVSKWIELQNAVNCYMDSSKDSNILAAKSQVGPAGIRQILERKEGLFRKHMMGKRVNFCCRSVISPDPYIGTNEIGVPVHFAMSLHYPTPVNSWNVKYLRGLVRRGPFQYPGANQIELADGRIIKLDHLSDMELAGKAKLLLPGIKVHRHLIDGDVLLVNRQPTLHKPGIMAHKARILMHVKEQTLRMHYANCNTYNADFDGDEMNCHFVQSELARAEASFICGTDQQYIGPTSGSPLRGLIQDHVASAVKLTCKDTFLSSAQFQQLVYVSLSGLPGTEIVTPADHIQLPAPAILRPRPLWTGKQVITALLAHLCRPPLPKLNLDAKAKTPATAFGEEHMEHEVVFRCGELLCGVLDKGAIGSSSLGIVHTVYELYGAELAGRLLGAFGKLFTCFLQTAGQTCGIQDLTLTRQADADRARLLKKVQTDSARGLAEWLRIIGPAQSTMSAADTERLDAKVVEFMSRDRTNAKILLDSKMQSIINASASDVIKACIPSGLEAPFTRNNFSIMVLTGAKGSSVNQSQISCFLGQQALEGQRVPLMVSGKSLPSFRPYDPSARAGGFVQDRFLTGVRPQEYFFHCMAGREGLVDTAVKTSRSGYLQRCLIKHLEELKVQYDMTVRDSAGNIVQFLYGEDGLDPVSASLLRGEANQMRFLARNNQAFVYKHSLRHDFFNQGLEIDSASAYHQRVANARRLLDSSRASSDHHLAAPAIITVGSVVQARRRKFPDLDWDRSNITGGWHTAVVKKVRHHSSDSSIGSRSIHEVRFDLQFADDGLLEKKVPLRILMQPRRSAGGGPVPRPGFNTLDPALSHCHKLPIYLVRPGLPDPAMSKLRLDYCVGAISERLQGKVDEYVKQNSDEVLASVGSDTTITPESLELLVWVKYLRSLACPGEAVGCVAAQSVGEPSTQMTLNTFHLAGHGGANVTLGIPRLREVIMVASRKLKTPTMFVPMRDPLDESGAESLSNKLSLVPLSHLLSHAGGIEVGEQIRRTAAGNKWERCYRLCLRFEDVRRIERTFGFPFSSIVAAVKGDFLTKLDRLIKLEQRRTGDSTAGGMNEVLKTLLGKDKSESGRAADTDRSDADSDDGPSPEKKASKGTTDMMRDDSDDDDSDDEGDLNDDLGNLKLSGSKKEVSHYADDDDSSDGGGPVDDRSLKKGADLDDRASDDDDAKEDGLSDDGAREDTGGGSGARSSSKRPPSKKSKAKPGGGSTSSFRREAFKSDEALGWVQVELSFSARSRRLLMTQLVEKASSVTMVRETKNIANAFKVERETRKWGVMTEGVNFEALWLQEDGLIATNEIESNDIWQILCTYGVEAARHSIVCEIKNVFAVYGINVDPRHLSLIADFMTRHGSYLPLNRSGMLSCPSPLQRMSFESTCSFLTRAAIEGQSDSLQSPSARIVLGGMTKVGTGCFDVMLPLSN